MSENTKNQHDGNNSADYPNGIFYVAFAIVIIESFVLVTSTVWGGRAPNWASEVLSQRSALLAILAATTVILSVILTIQPGGLAKHAALGAAVLSLGSATVALESQNLAVGLALLGTILPIYIITFPSVQLPEKLRHIIGLGPVTIF